MIYTVILDEQKQFLEKLPVVEADSPLTAARKYAGCEVVRKKMYGQIAIESSKWPYKTYLYDRISG